MSDGSDPREANVYHEPSETDVWAANHNPLPTRSPTEEIREWIFRFGLERVRSWVNEVAYIENVETVENNPKSLIYRALQAIAGHGYMSEMSDKKQIIHVADWMVDTARAALVGSEIPELTDLPRDEAEMDEVAKLRRENQLLRARLSDARLHLGDALASVRWAKEALDKDGR